MLFVHAAPFPPFLLRLAMNLYTSSSREENEGDVSKNPAHEPFPRSPVASAVKTAEGKENGRSDENASNTTAELTSKGKEEGSSFIGYVARGRRSRLRPVPLPPSFADPLQEPQEPPPLVVLMHRDVEEVGFTYAQLWRVRYNLISPVYIAFKTAALVTLPLCILSFSDKTKSTFKAGSLLAVVGTANTKLYLGQQIAGSVVILQGAAWVVIWGTIVAALNMTAHPAAWWSMAFTSIVFVSFFTNFRSRRLMMSYTIIAMQLVRSTGGLDISTAANAGGDLMLAVCFAMFQAFVPYPLLMSNYTDEVFKRSWKRVATICHDLRSGVWSGRAFSGNVAASEVACDELGSTAKGIPDMLFFISYEPFERSLYNQLRNERLTLLKRLLVILNATCTGARVFTSMSSSETREALVQWKKILQEPVDEFIEALQAVMHELGESLVPAETLQRVPFEALQQKKDAMLRAMQSCRRYVATMASDTTDAPAFYSFLYFHLLLALQADELHTFAEQLAAFDPSKYKSTARRCLEFFFLDFYNDFRLRLLGRVTLRTKEDVRSFKDGLKLACAYLVAAAFTMKLNEGDDIDTYFFGMSIILGMGLPTVAESIEVGVHRISGMAYALVIGYIAKWKTHSFVQEIAVVVCGSFIALCFRDNVRYMHVAWYASFIAPAAYGIANNRVTMIARVVDNSFAVMSYFIICTMMFPINPYRVLWNKRSFAEKKMSDTITILATVDGVTGTREPHDIVQARLTIVAENLRAINDLVNQSQQWVGICAKEPSLIGNPFPTEQVQRMQILLQHICAGLEIWLFGLQLLHRPRSTPLHPIMVKMLDALRPLLLDLEVASRVVFQDLIDAVNMPLEWTVEKSVRRFSDFVLIKGRMDAVYYKLHKDMILTQNVAIRRAMANSGEKELESFVSRSVIQQDVHNVRVVPGYADHSTETHALDEIRDRSFESNEESATREPGAQSHAAAMAAAVVVSREGRGRGDGLAGPSSQDRSFNLSFRAPTGNLPIDVDVTAFTIVISSVAALAASLEQMVPFMSATNRFVRSRFVKPFSMKEFFLCKT